MTEDLNNEAPVMPSPPPIFTFELTPRVVPKFAEFITFKFEPKKTLPLTPRPPTIDNEPVVDDVEFVLLLIVYWPCKVVLNDGAAPEEAVVKIAPLADEACVACMADVPLPYKTPLEVNVDAPVPPYIVFMTEPFQMPDVIVPKVVIDV